LSLLIGAQGLGKSTWLAWLAAQHSLGLLNSEPGVTLVCSAEDGWATTIRPRLEAQGANLALIRFVEIALDDGSADGLRLPEDVAELRRGIHDTGATLVTIDPVLAHLGHEIDSHRDASTRQALAPLARLADEHDAAIVAAHHLNKSMSNDPLARASASGAFTMQPRSVLLWARDPEDPDGERGRQRALGHVKSNLSPEAPTQTWSVEPIVLPAVGTSPEVETSRVVLTGESSHSGRSLLTRREDDEHVSAVEEAEDFLRAELAFGPVDSKTILRSARDMGISEKTLRRAKDSLGAAAEKKAFGAGWEWRLELADQDGQGGWPSSKVAKDSEHVGHLPTDGSAMRVCGVQQTLETAEGGQDVRVGHLRAARAPFPLVGDSGYLAFVADRHRADHLTTAEALELEKLHRLVAIVPA